MELLPRHRALAVALLYLLFGALWIAFSDAAVEGLAGDAQTLTRLQTWKGWLYVLVTAGLVYVLVRGALASEARLARSLRQAEERLRLVLDTIPSRVLWKDRSGRYLGANARFARDAGFDEPERLVGLTDQDLPWRDQVDTIRETDQRIVSGQEARIDYELALTDATGRLRHEVVTKVPLRDAEGTITGVLASYEDVTERKLAERQLRHAQKLQAIGELTSGVTHDFKNVLSVIIANAELVAPTLPPDSDEARALGDVRSAAESAAGMVRKLLGFSREGDLALGPTDLRPVVHDLAPMLSRMLSAAYRLDVVAEEELPPALADADAVEQMVLNLISNARDAMPGGGRILLRLLGPSAPWDAPMAGSPPAQLLGAEPPPSGGRFVSIHVHDAGTGMTPDVAERVIEPFFTTKAAGEGTGLGLSMVYGLMRQHGGFLTLRTAAGEGAVFGLYFPVVPGDAVPTSRRPASPAARLEAGHGTILLVDDQADLRRTGARVLRRYGYTVLEAANGVEALAVYGREGPRIDLVLTDFIMPEMNGIGLLERLRAEGATVPVALSSGHADLAEAVERRRVAAVPIIPKPWTVEQLVSGVRAVLEASRR